MPQAALSSSSIPVAFPPQHFKGHVLMDGGTVWNVNIDSAINQCIDMGFAPSDIILDIAVTDERGFVDEHSELSKNAFYNFWRARNIGKAFRDSDNVF